MGTAGHLIDGPATVRCASAAARARAAVLNRAAIRSNDPRDKHAGKFWGSRGTNGRILLGEDHLVGILIFIFRHSVYNRVPRQLWR